jgi:hypothetical protein
VLGGLGARPQGSESGASIRAREAWEHWEYGIVNKNLVLVPGEHGRMVPILAGDREYRPPSFFVVARLQESADVARQHVLGELQSRLRELGGEVSICVRGRYLKDSVETSPDEAGSYKGIGCYAVVVQREDGIYCLYNLNGKLAKLHPSILEYPRTLQ